MSLLIARCGTMHPVTTPGPEGSARPKLPAFKRLWQPPGRYEARPMDRRVSFLELFFDLVFVAVIAQLAHRLAEHPTWEGVGWFVFLFYAVWSSWLNGTLYYDIHTTDDLSVRVFTFGQMVAVAIMAALIGDVPGQGSAGFALAYAADTLILTILWFRTGLHDPTHRPASIPYSTAYLISAALFAASAAVATPGRYWLWAAALVIEMGGFVIAMTRWTPPDSQTTDAVIPATASLIERMGLFVIIVLGEVVVGAVNGIGEITPRDFDAVAVGVLGVLVAIGLWWIYFDVASHEPPIARRTQLWLYLHLPLVIAMAAGGAGVVNTVANANEPLPDGVRWLLVGSLAVAEFSVALIVPTLELARDLPRVYRFAKIGLAVSAVLCLGVGLTEWGAKATLGAMALLLLAPVAGGIFVWVRNTDDDVLEFG